MCENTHTIQVGSDITYRIISIYRLYALRRFINSDKLASLSFLLAESK
jgi:hypothetical protein